MWNVLPKFLIIKSLAFLFAILFLTVIIICFGGDDFTVSLSKDNVIEILKYSGIVAIFFFVLVLLIAKWGWLVLWHCPWLGSFLNKNVCPNLNGTWKGEIVSSFKDANGNPTKKTVEMEIEADFIGFKIKLKSVDSYQQSTVTQCEIYKDDREGNYYLSYIFMAVVPRPLPSDDRNFEGSAKLVIRFEDGDLKLVGTYCTNRALQRGLNTAGTIELHRLKKS